MDGQRPRLHNEVGIMADFANPAQISEYALGLSQPDYMKSWAGYTTEPRFAHRPDRLAEVRSLAEGLADARDELRRGPTPPEMLGFGLFSVVDHFPKELTRTTAEFYGELLEQVEAAETLGFRTFWVAEHHFHEYGGIPRPPVWMAAAAARTRRIRLGAGVVVLPFDNPLRTAEDYAMVDVLSGGRLDLGTGSGYLKHEYAGFNLDPEEKRARFDEALEILLRAWTGERFSYEGRYHLVRDVQLNVRPLQRPRPPIWVATLRADSAPRIGARGFPAMLIP